MGHWECIRYIILSFDRAAVLVFVNYNTVFGMKINKGLSKEFLIMDAKTILSIWEKTFSEKVDYLSEHLADDLVIEFMGKNSSSQTKDEHIAWSISDESPTIGDFKVIFEENGVAVGTHTAVNPQGEGRDIMYYGKFENNKVTEWKVLVSVQDES